VAKSIVCRQLSSSGRFYWHSLPTVGNSSRRSWSTLLVQSILGGLALDGEFGPRTRRSLKAYQRYWNANYYQPGGDNVVWNFRVPVDGVVSAGDGDWYILQTKVGCQGGMD
jgi:peptidoglycan hydrolase-like protein with peptidoglycan-binding domain